MGKEYILENLIRELVGMQFIRSTAEWKPGMFLLKGDIFEIWPSSSEEIIRLEFFGDELEKITKIEHLTNVVLEHLDEVTIFPAKHFVTEKGIIENILPKIKAEMEERIKYFESVGKIVEAERIKMRTEYDMEMLAEVGYVNGIENYSMYLGNRNPGDAPSTLIEFFRHLNHPSSQEDWIADFQKKEMGGNRDFSKKTQKNEINTDVRSLSGFLTFIDESHITIPQIGGMYA